MKLQCKSLIHFECMDIRNATSKNNVIKINYITIFKCK